MALWICKKCGNETTTMGDKPPMAIMWFDDHKCQLMRIDTFSEEEQKRIIKSIENNL